MDLKTLNSLIETLYGEVSGYQLSNTARKKLQYYDRSFTYGEVVVESMVSFMKEIRPKKDDVFYDLGSGAGKAVFVAALAFQFQKSVGIELLDDLYLASETALHIYKKQIEPGLLFHPLPQIEFRSGDILREDFSDGDIIFLHATCFHDSMMRVLCRKIEQLKKGARILSVSKTVESPKLRHLTTKSYPFSWGNASLHSYEKVV